MTQPVSFVRRASSQPYALTPQPEKSSAKSGRSGKGMADARPWLLRLAGRGAAGNGRRPRPTMFSSSQLRMPSSVSNSRTCHAPVETAVDAGELHTRIEDLEAELAAMRAERNGWMARAMGRGKALRRAAGRGHRLHF